MVDPKDPVSTTGSAPVGTSVSPSRSADTQNQPTVLVKVRAKRERGFIRGGVHWPPSETYRRVTEDAAKQLEAEPLLQVSRVGDSEVPDDQRGQLAAADATSEKSPEQQRDELVDGEFPRLNQSQSGATIPNPAPDQAAAIQAQQRRAPLVDATGRAVPEGDPNARVRREDEPLSETHSFGAGSSAADKKKR
jgi:hypothetical protein